MDDFSMACLRELASLDRELEFTRAWYERRMDRLSAWALEELAEPQRKQFFNIVANGAASVMEPPSSTQNFNSMKSRAENAEAELVRLHAARMSATPAGDGLLRVAARAALASMDQMLRDGEWYQAQERADALRAILGDDANADVQAIEEALHEAIKQFGPQRLAKALAEYAPGETASVDRSRQRT